MKKLSIRRSALVASAFFFLSSGGSIHAATPRADAPQSSAVEMIVIPGPLRSFMRMAAISQKVSPDDVVPLLARNIFMQGYQQDRQT
ncbi:MAG: hypothetical protein ACRD3K_03290, partial [Edaphobacter sp.]